jgi:opacity protein-like surface antigen
LETKAQETPKPVEEPQKLSDENVQKKPVEEPQKLSDENIQKKPLDKETVTDEPKDINQKLQDLQKQVDTLREMGRTREKLAITEKEKAEQEKAVLTAAGREYTMMQKGKIEMQYSLQYAYVSSSSILSATSIVARANQTITNAIDVQYGLLKNVTAGIHVPFVYVYDKTGSATAKDDSDMGDISLNLSYQPFKNSGDWPTTTIIMGAVLPTGRSPYEINRDTDLPTGGGLYGLSLGMNMSKSIDPAMAFGSISCSYNLERDGLSQNINGAMLEDVKPGMSFGAAIGLAYSISYVLSMNVSFQYGYAMSTDYHFSNAATGATSPAFSTGSLTVGVGYRVSPLTTLSLGLSIGLTNNDADFSFLLRVPFSF